MFSKHVTKNISAYCHGELSSDDSKLFAEHIISCAKCRTRYEEIKQVISLAEQLPQLSSPASLWTELEPLLTKQTDLGEHQVSGSAPFFTPRRTQFAALAAMVLVVTSLVALWLYRNRSPNTLLASWQVQRLDGIPRIGSTGIANKGQLGVGQWLETDANSRAEIAVGSIGNVEIESNTRVRLLETRPTEHRLELARGKMSAWIWAPPRLFFVDTPSAVAADLGCAYTLEVDDEGASLLRVTSGWVALELNDRESIVPAGAACQTRPGIGPGTPYFEDAPHEFRGALVQLDFDNNPAVRTSALESVLTQSRPRDTLTLWHLLARVDGNDRIRVYDKMAGFGAPPAGVTREGVLQLDQKMLELWRDELELNWGDSTQKQFAKGWWKIKNGVKSKSKQAPPDSSERR